MSKVRKIIRQKNTAKIRKPPGTLIYIGQEKDTNISIDLLVYNAESYEEKSIVNHIPDTHFPLDGNVSWIDIKGLHNEKLIEEIGKTTNIHALTLEDLLNTEQRPKIDFFHTYIYIVIQTIQFNDNSQDIESEQLSIILGENYVMTFLEKPSYDLDILKERIKNKIGKIRIYGADYLAYTILDIVIDDYYDVIEKLGDKIEAIEEALMFETNKIEIQDIYILKRKLLEFRKIIWPIREILTKLEKNDTLLIKEKTALYLRDLYDHNIQLIDNIDIYRDIVSGLADVYLTKTSNRLNEIMKILTILSSIFIPLTFIVGIYGMNFNNMPELEWEYGYFFALAFMFIIAIGMAIYFKRKKWL
ncbi:MAG: magnesium/cobalt transporter CorA [Chitinophagales bacterium]|nr:magnesium/cobalt transporter CorA [Chitinophagales bacterium]